MSVVSHKRHQCRDNLIRKGVIYNVRSKETSRSMGTLLPFPVTTTQKNKKTNNKNKKQTFYPITDITQF